MRILAAGSSSKKSILGIVVVAIFMLRHGGGVRRPEQMAEMGQLLPVALPSRVSGVGATLPVPRPPERQVSREDVPPIQYEVLDRSPLTPAGAGR